MNNVFNIEDYRDLIDIIQLRLGDKFAIAYIENNECSVCFGKELTDMEKVYIADTINKTTVRE